MRVNFFTCLGIVGALVLTAWLSHFLFIIAFLLCIVIPGYCLLQFLPLSSLTKEERLILSIGFGIAWIPVVSILSKLLHIPITSLTILAWIIALAAVSLWWRTRSYPQLLTHLSHSSLNPSFHLDAHHLLLIGLLFICLVTRLAPVRHLLVPLFTDPALQGMITRLIIEHKQIPATWEPFLPLSFHHQPGFASIVAWLALLSGLPIPKLILFLTNLLHALFPFSVYFLASSLFTHRLQRFVAAFLTALAMFPTATFVAGMNAAAMMYFLVPLAAGVSMRVLQMRFDVFGSRKKYGFIHHWIVHWRVVILLSILFTGALFIHPTFLVFFILLVAPYGIIFVSARRNRVAWILLGLSLLLCLAFAVPYFWNTASSSRNLLEQQWYLQAELINPERRLSPWLFIEPMFFLFDNPSGRWFFYLNDASLLGLLLMRTVGVVFSGLLLWVVVRLIRDRDRLGVYLLSIYGIFLALSWGQSTFAFAFPGWQAIYPTRVKFLIVVPAALLLSCLVANMRIKGLRRPNKPFGYTALLLFILIAPHNAQDLVRLLQSLSERSPVSVADQKAIDWIGEHVPKDAVILNAIRDVEAGVFIGGPGQWIPALTGHTVLFPPLSLTEDVQDLRVTKPLQLMDDLTKGKASHPDFAASLARYNVRYIFLSDRIIPTQRLIYPKVSVEQFLESPKYRLEYQNDQTYVFSVRWNKE